MSAIFTKREAIDFLQIDDKVFDNYFKVAEEFNHLPRSTPNGRFKFSESELREWKRSYDYRTVELNRKEYDICLDFALAMHFRGYVVSDFGSGRQREFGQKVTNWVKGQLGEVGFQRFLKDKFDVDVELDFNIYKEIVPQDIIGVFDNGKRRKPHIGIGIKSSKPKNAYLILDSNEVELAERRSDVYVFCRVDIPDDHLLRIARNDIISSVKGGPLFDNYKDLVPTFTNIKCEVAGWCRFNELQTVNSIPGQPFEGERKVIQSGKLRKSIDDWKELISLL